MPSGGFLKPVQEDKCPDSQIRPEPSSIFWDHEQYDKSDPIY